MNNQYVCITDGDIVYENNLFIDFLLENIHDNDLLIQSEGLEIDDLCSGFMFIKSNVNTLSIFNPNNVEKYKNFLGWDDQVYINEIKYKLNYKVLPLNLFPTGKYYYQYYNNINPYLIHFNWVVGNDKLSKMIRHNKWNKKINICQYGTDGFGHQLEGMLRLISLSINNKANYQYNFRKDFQFEHSNFDIEILNKYLLESLNTVSLIQKNIDIDIDIEKNIKLFIKKIEHFPKFFYLILIMKIQFICMMVYQIKIYLKIYLLILKINLISKIHYQF